MSSLPASPEPQGLRQRLTEFFYAEEIPYGLALVRICLSVSLLVSMLPRWVDAREMFSTDGASTPLWMLYGYMNLLPEVPGAAAVVMHSLLLFFLVCSALGWQTRLSLIATTVLYTWLNLLDSISTMTKFSVMATHGLFLLCLSDCGRVWSLDSPARRRRWPGESGFEDRRSPVWPRRLMQLMMGLVYFGAAITKLHTPPYFSGEQLIFWMISDLNWEHALGERLAMYPTLVIFCAYATMIWEVLFVFLCWRGISRAVMLGLGIVFHVATMFTLGLIVFPLICFSMYLAFVNEQDVQAIGRIVRRVWRQLGGGGRAVLRPTVGAGPMSWRRPSPAVFACAIPAVALVGLGAEYWLDPYGLRRPEGRHTLRVLPPEQVHAMLGPSQPIRPEDKIFGLDIGTMLVGGTILDRRTVFRQGDRFIAQVQMNPPYEDMWMECNLHDADDHLVARSSGVAVREAYRCTFHHGFPCSLEPGRYSVVLSVAGKEVARRTITLQPRTGAVLGN